MLSVFTLLNPEAAAPHAALMAAAAAAGDFDEWPACDADAALYGTRDAALKLDMALCAIGESAGGDAAAYAAAFEALPALLAPGGCAPPAAMRASLAACIG